VRLRTCAWDREAHDAAIATNREVNRDVGITTANAGCGVLIPGTRSTMQRTGGHGSLAEVTASRVAATQRAAYDSALRGSSRCAKILSRHTLGWGSTRASTTKAVRVSWCCPPTRRQGHPHTRVALTLFNTSSFVWGARSRPPDPSTFDLHVGDLR
jgi:hypothetical protein